MMAVTGVAAVGQRASRMPRACKRAGFMVRSAAPAAEPSGPEMTDSIIVDTATRIFADLCEPATINAAEAGKWPQALWDALEESGLTLTWVPDTLGGAGRSEERRVGKE